MTSPTPTRSALTPAVYWRRRLFAVGVLLALVLIVVNAVQGGSTPDAGVKASTAGADQAIDATGQSDEDSVTGPTVSTDGATTGKKGKKGKESATPLPEPSVVLPTAPVLAEPEGECDDADLAVTPTVEDAVAGRSATIVLKLRTVTAEACTWSASTDSLAVRISVGSDEVWASRECPAAVPVRSIVVRKAVTATYRLTWNTRRSDTDCPRLTEYAQPGEYRVTAAALGGEPDFEIFTLAPPPAPEPPAMPDAEKMPTKKGKKANAG